MARTEERETMTVDYKVRRLVNSGFYNSERLIRKEIDSLIEERRTCETSTISREYTNAITILEEHLIDVRETKC
jgi:hypothetical protein